MIGQYTPWSLAYADCYIISEEKQTGIQLKTGSADLSQVLLNNEQAYIHAHPRSNLDDLEQGINTLVFKVANGVGGWDGSVRMTDRDGDPVEAIRVTLDPTADDPSNWERASRAFGVRQLLPCLSKHPEWQCTLCTVLSAGVAIAREMLAVKALSDSS